MSELRWRGGRPGKQVVEAIASRVAPGARPVGADGGGVGLANVGDGGNDMRYSGFAIR